MAQNAARTPMNHYNMLHLLRKARVCSQKNWKITPSRYSSVTKRWVRLPYKTSILKLIMCCLCVFLLQVPSVQVPARDFKCITKKSVKVNCLLSVITSVLIFGYKDWYGICNSYIWIVMVTHDTVWLSHVILARVYNKEEKWVSNTLYALCKMFSESHAPGIQKLTSENTQFRTLIVDVALSASKQYHHIKWKWQKNTIQNERSSRIYHKNFT